MSAGSQEARRIVLVQAATALAKDATEAARSARAGSAEWRFYHGVETAALHLLRPEVASVREGTSWAQAEEPAFREGFLEASALLASAATAADPPMRIRLPEPPERRNPRTEGTKT